MTALDTHGMDALRADGHYSGIGNRVIADAAANTLRAADTSELSD